MPSVAERLEQVELKVKRAKEHVADLQVEISRFTNADPKPYACGIKRDPKTREIQYYMTRVEPTPKCLPLIAGDAVQNLMGALDHLAYQIVCSDTGDNPPRPTKIYFPIANSAVEYDEPFKRRKITGALKDSIDAIDALEPYKGGKGNHLWVLQALNNIEKHRLLMLVASSIRSINIGAHLSREMAKARKMAKIEGVDLPDIPVLDAFYMVDPMFPLKTGDVICTFAPQFEPDEQLQFRFDVALHQPQIIEAKSVLEALHEFTTLVERIVVALTPRLRDTP